MERRLAAILAADVVGYSRLMGDDEAGTLDALKAHRDELIDPKIAEHHGRIVKLMGDGVLVEFASVVDAVECAVEIQRAMAERNAEIPDGRRIRLRIGINLGDVIVEGDDLYGDGVNVAARVEGLARPSGVCISRPVLDQIEGKLDIPFSDAGVHRVKNIARPIHVWHWAADAPTFHVDETVASEPLPLPDKPSIAVLPFDNMSGEPEQDYFCDGIVEELTAALSRVRSFFVIARNSSFTYKGRAVNVKQVSRELGVRYVVEGSVRKSGARVRITAQLIDATSGAHIWADRFDGVLEDIFELQDRITEDVVGAIEPKLRSAEIDRAKRKRPEDLDAYDCFLRALPHVHAMTAEGNAAALGLLGNAIEIDPGYGSAMALAAWCYTLRPAQGWVVSKEDEAREGLRLARTAIENDRENPETLWLAGYALAYFGNALDEGSALIGQSLVLDPNAAQAWVFSGWVKCYRGEAQTAVEHFERAIRLSPLDPAAYRTHAGLAFACLFSRRYDDAVSWATRALQGNPNFTVAHRVLAASLAHAGRPGEARAVIAQLLTLVPNLTIARFSEDTRFRYPEYFALLMDGMRKAGLPE